MALRYVLDTNTLSEPVRPVPDSQVIARIQMTQDQLAITSITWHEALFGMFRMPQSRKRTVIERYLIDQVQVKLPILPYDAAAAAWFAEERARLAAIGRIRLRRRPDRRHRRCQQSHPRHPKHHRLCRFCRHHCRKLVRRLNHDRA